MRTEMQQYVNQIKRVFWCILKIDFAIFFFLAVVFKRIALRRIPKFYLISWCANFVERHSFRRVSGDSPKTLGKLCLFAKCPHQEIR